MLWESVDPGRSLTKRFGFVDADAASTWVREVLSSQWAIDIDRCDRLVISGWNAMAWVVRGEQRFVAKWSAVPTNFGQLRDAAAITTFVHQRGVPAAAPIPSSDGRLLVEQRNLSNRRLRSLLPVPGGRFLVGVLPVVDGELLDVDDPAQVVEAAHTLASLHELLATYPHRLQGGSPSEGQQIVHNDFRSSNLLQDEGRITAVLDFEEITYESRMADLAKATVFLGTRYRNWGPMRAEAREAFVAAYVDCIPLTAADQREVARRVAAGLHEQGWS